MADTEKADLKGYMLLSDVEKSVFHVREMWNVNFPASQQTITNIGKCLQISLICTFMYWYIYFVMSRRNNHCPASP